MTIGGLTWDDTGNRYYYTGIDGVALFVWDEVNNWYHNRTAWNGVTAINENPSGAESNKLYADNIEYLNLLSKEEFGLTLECYNVPEAFDACDGIYGADGFGSTMGPRKPFGLVYRVQKGSDTTNAGELGYVYHVVYGCKASPSSKDHSTVNDSPEAQTFSYEITTTATSSYPGSDMVGAYGGFSPFVHLEIDDTSLTAYQKEVMARVLYARDNGRMPYPGEIAVAASATE